MKNPRLINVDNAIKELEELEEYSFVMTDKQVKFFLANQPTIDPTKNGYVLLGVLRQVQWERDIAIDQLHSYGVEFGEKAEMQRVRHGKWNYTQDLFGDTLCNCSVCGIRFVMFHGTTDNNLYNYCPNCGAYMRGDDNVNE